MEYFILWSLVDGIETHVVASGGSVRTMDYTSWYDDNGATKLVKYWLDGTKLTRID